MYFYVDFKRREILAFFKKGQAARHYLKLRGLAVGKSANPMLLYPNGGDKTGIVLNLQEAFEWISVVEGITSAELAVIFSKSVEDLYNE